MAPSWDNGAVRGVRVRCPGCTRFNPPGVRCPSCACGPVAPEHYGAARMLLHAGVDRFALTGRLEALEPGLARQLAAQYAAQWAGALRIVEDARRCEAFLTLGGFVEEAEDRWADVLPWSQPPASRDAAPEEDDPLEALYQRSEDPGVRQLAALAAVNRGRPSRELYSAAQGALYADGLARLEAALALTRWRVWFVAPSGRPQRELIARHARDVFANHPEHAARAAVAWVRATGKAPEVDLLLALREGLRAQDEDIAFECALVLEDELGLLAALGSGAEDRAALSPGDENRAALGSGAESRAASDSGAEDRAASDSDAEDRAVSDSGAEGRAALRSRDEDKAARNADDEDRAALAARTLASMGAPALLPVLRETRSAVLAREVMRRWPAPASWDVVDALLTISSGFDVKLIQALTQWAPQTPFMRLAPEVRERWRQWAHDSLGALPAPHVLRMLEWVRDGDEAPDDASARAFQRAAAQALSSASSSERAELLHSRALVDFLVHGDVEELALVHTWARDAACAAPLLELLVSLPGRLRRERPAPGRCARLLMAAWERPARSTILAPLNKAVRSWSGISGRDELIDAVWLRFQCHPAERAELLAVFEPWRQELWERQLAAQPDAIAIFETWWRVDSQKRLPELVSFLVENAPSDTLPERLPFVWAAAEARVDAWPRSTSHAVFLAAAPLAGALRSGHDALVPDAERFLAWFPGFEARVLAASSPEAESSYQRDLLEDLHVEVRLMREALERRAEEAEALRQAELRKRVEESRRRDQERQLELARLEVEAAALEAARARAEQEAHQARLADALARLGPRPAQLRRFDASPQVELLPIDVEVIFPGATMASVLDYSRILKALSGDGDWMELLAANGMSMTSWGTEARAWSEAMIRRPELSLRFSQLFHARWS
ncbi:hypothetical protein SAMN05443572_101766 [Myxococcus fulvus]|uniref:Uncharacterized protein n=1 Tax=Myxococcus fulvus TaxID=33 RepID=A0A511SUU2_MYXFU|nr:hypothetical protein [Myxococcus fulvus]GEN05686.1 hypothetical protein MFU01_07230 [Myxococcus fulvus]SES98796.1 hypothetical protein SAMN05443572_101766 [Myxococcus fulvus]